MRELRHDFRRVYGCRYEDVDPEEAIDLIMTLPRGSLWRSAQIEYGEWDDAKESSADVVDAISRLTSLLSSAGSTEGAQLVVRPEMLRERKKALERAKSTRKRIAETDWEEVGTDG